jgi:hypothetical protein
MEGEKRVQAKCPKCDGTAFRMLPETPHATEVECLNCGHVAPFVATVMPRGSSINLPIFGLIDIDGGHALLEIDSALHGIDGTRELDQHAIAGHLENAALVPGDQKVQHITAPPPEGSQRRGLVRFHHSAVANNVGGW